MRNELTRERLRTLMQEIARVAPPRRGAFQVYLVGGGTAVYSGWRAASIDVDLYSDREEVFHDVQGIKERLNVNIEFARPEHFVPALRGTAGRHVLIETIPPVTFHHYDPYAQVFAKIVRGFTRDLDDARHFVDSGMVDESQLRLLVGQIPESEFARYPNLSRSAVVAAVDVFFRSEK
ncbi:MAG: hypothetical protein SGI90_13025 [Candidatus Eisenbacteria bacterium]|nr:hypothetical protein [Candidatus Eisenbacteria bacterium]